MIKTQKFKILFILFIFSFLLFDIFAANAAEVFLESKKQQVALEEQFIVDVFLNTTEESINAVEGKIFFPDNFLEVKEIQDGNSIINFWVEKPFLNSKSNISYAGIIPGGYKETKGFLFSIVFQAKANGNGIIEIRDVKSLLNDGKGTLTKTIVKNLEFKVQNLSKDPAILKNYILTPQEDKDLPEDFKPEIAQNPTMFNKKWFIVFSTQDKGLGIADYAIYESRKIEKQIAADAWEKATSPYVLKDQDLESFIYVKAIDKAGNERIVVTDPKYLLKQHKTWLNLIIIAIVLVIVFIASKILWKKYIKSYK